MTSPRNDATELDEWCVVWRGECCTGTGHASLWSRQIDWLRQKDGDARCGGCFHLMLPSSLRQCLGVSANSAYKNDNPVTGGSQGLIRSPV